MALVFALSGVAAPIGMALGGLLGELTNNSIPFIYLACGTLIALLTVGAATRSPVREFLESDTEATPVPPWTLLS